jgi:hypothetical protein
MPSIKLSVTVRKPLEKKYSTKDLKKIDKAVKGLIAADKKRGIITIHVALDDSAAMKKLGVKAISGSVTATEAKVAIDGLWKKVAPSYLVLFGGDDIVPYFEVANPSYQPSGDDDKTVLTDNPYACSQPFRRARIKSYLVPDRVVGRIPDMPGDSDPEWILQHLAVATTWTSWPKATYKGGYAICCNEWKSAGKECVQYLGENASQMMISPPNVDTSRLPQSRLGNCLHLIKCHGSQIDPKFYGQKGNNYPESLTSATLRKKLKPNTVAAAMCCYGAQTFSPNDPASQNPGEWSIAGAYLRGGAFGFAGSTCIAWVGGDVMMCADLIASKYLRLILDGASQGHAFMATKQEYVLQIQQDGMTLGREDEKTLIEYILLGDPSIQPVITAAQPSPAGLVRAAGPASRVGEAIAMLRQNRRIYRATLAVQIRQALPARMVHKPKKQRVKSLFQTAAIALRASGSKMKLRAETVHIDRIETRISDQQRKAAGITRAALSKHGTAGIAAITGRHETYQYYWSGRREMKGHKQVTMVRVDSDATGAVLHTRVIQSS